MTITLNGKTYETKKKITFYEITKIEQAGVNLFDLAEGKNMLSSVLGMVCYITGLTPEKASEEIESHLENGGSVDDIVSCFNVLLESDFFKKAVATKKK